MAENMQAVFEQLSRDRLKIGETGDLTRTGSFCLTLLQKLSGKYHIMCTFLELCLSTGRRYDWRDLTSFLAPGLSESFTKDLIRIYHCNDRDDEIKEVAILELIASKTEKSFADIDYELLQPSSVIILDNVYHPIIPEWEFYTDQESYILGLKDDFVGLNYAKKFAIQLLSRSSDIIDAINSVVALEERLKIATSFEHLYSIIGSTDSNDYFYLLQRMSEFSNAILTSREGIQHLKDIKENIVNALENELKMLLATHRDDANHDIKRYESLLQVESGIERIKIRLEEEEAKLASNQLSYNERKDIISQIKQMKESGAWIQIKTCLKKTLSSAKYKVNRHQTFKEIYTNLLALQHVTKLDPSFRMEDMFNRLESKKNLLCDILTKKFNFAVDYILVSKCYTIKGAVIFLSDVIQEIEGIKDIKSDKFFQFHVSASEIVYLDVDFPKELGKSRNLIIEGTKVSVLPQNGSQICIDLSGDHGAKVPPSNREKTAASTAGYNGESGNDGKSAGNLLINSYERLEGVQFLRVFCNGGNGSNGEDGDDGGDGRDGDQGKTATIPAEAPSDTLCKIWTGGKGEDGKRGGKGGTGRLGGLGGSKGSIIVNSEQKRIPSKNFVAKDGAEGDCGKPGKPGKSGKGGPHGKDNAWYREASWLVWHSWQRADQATKWKNDYKPDGKDLYLIEADCSTWLRAGKTTVRSCTDRGSGSDAPDTLPTEPIKNDEKNQHFSAQVPSISLAATTIATSASDNQEFLATKAQVSRNNFMLYSLELDILEIRKAKVFEEIRLQHQVTVNMMEMIQVTAAPPDVQPDHMELTSSLPEINPPLTTNKVEKYYASGPDSCDLLSHNWCQEIVATLEQCSSRSMTSTVQVLICVTFRRWSSIPLPFKFFIPTLLKYENNISQSDLLELRRLSRKHLSEIASDDQLEELEQWYANVVISREIPETVALETELETKKLADEGRGAILRDIILWYHKRKAIAEYRNCLEAIPPDESLKDKKGKHKKGMLATVTQGLGAMIHGATSKANQLANYVMQRDQKKLVKMSTESFELALNQLIPMFRELFDLETKRNTLRFTKYFDVIRTTTKLNNDNPREFRGVILKEITGISKEKFINSLTRRQKAINIPFTKFLLQNLNFTPDELDFILGKVEENIKFYVSDLDSSFMCSIFVENAFIENVRALRSQNKEISDTVDSILKILSSPLSHIQFARRVDYLKDLMETFDINVADMLSYIISDMHSSFQYGKTDDFEVLLDRNNITEGGVELKKQLNGMIYKLRLNRETEQLPSLPFLPLLHTLEIGTLELEIGIFSFSVQDLAEIEQQINTIEFRLYRWIQWIVSHSFGNSGADTNGRNTLQTILNLSIINTSSEANCSFRSLAHSVQSLASELAENVPEAQKFLAEFETLVKETADPTQINSFSKWDFRAHVLTLVHKLMVILGSRFKHDSNFKRLVTLFRLKSVLYRMKHSLHTAWMRSAYVIQKKFANEASVAKTVEKVADILMTVVSGTSLDAEFQLLLGRLVFLGLTDDIFKLNRWLGELKEKLGCDSSSEREREVNMAELKSLLNQYKQTIDTDESLHNLGITKLNIFGLVHTYKYFRFVVF